MARKGREDRPGRTGGWEPSESTRPDLSFHYSREERLAMGAAPKVAATQGFLRRNRSLLIVFADIAILLVLGFVALRFFGPPAGTSRAGPFRVSLRGLQYGEVVFATVTLRRVGGEDRGQELEPRAFARFTLTKDSSDGEAYFDSAPLPRLKGEEVVLRASLPLDGDGERVYVEVRAGEHTVRLSLPRSAW